MEIDVQSCIIKILNENGIEVDGVNAILDFDSLTFVSIIVCIEDEFDLVIPDDILTRDNFLTVQMYIDNINKLIKEKQNEIKKI
jgi:phosphopantetheine attachment domain protein